MKTDTNQYTVNSEYSDLQKSVSKILSERGAKENMLTFSIFEDANPDEKYNLEKWPVLHPDFCSIFEKGKVRFVEPRHGFKSKVVINPTWADVVWFANESILHGMKKNGLDGWDHVFLELVEPKEKKNGVQVFKFWFGS
jgi:hypothetical protein